MLSYLWLIDGNSINSLNKYSEHPKIAKKTDVEMLI